MEERDFVTENNGIILYINNNRLNKPRRNGIVKKARTIFKRGCNFLWARYNISTHKTRVLMKGREIRLWKSTSSKQSPSGCWTL